MSTNTIQKNEMNICQEQCDDNLCEVCKMQMFKYRCPACGMKTCSLKCVNNHKSQNDCDGLRKPIKFVPIKEFNDDIITDDYYYLHHLAEVVDNNSRTINSTSSYNHQPIENHKQTMNQLPKILSVLQRQTKLRKMNVRFMPKGMTRQQENQSKYIYKTGQIEWMIEWIFPSVIPIIKQKTIETELTLARDSVHHLLNENMNMTLKTLLNKYRSVGVDGLVLLIERLDEGERNEYYMLPMDQPWRTLLAGLTLVEFPTIYVVLASDLPKYKLIPYTITELPAWVPPQPRKPRNNTSKQLNNKETKDVINDSKIENSNPIQTSDTTNNSEEIQKITEIKENNNTNITNNEKNIILSESKNDIIQNDIIQNDIIQNDIHNNSSFITNKESK